MGIALTRDLGKFVSQISLQDIPTEALSVIRTGFADCIGTMIAGASEPAPRILLDTLAPCGNEATLMFGDKRASALDAAWINATAAHALDFDDFAVRGHPTAVLLPAILAEGEVLQASGIQMLVAYAAGYETWAELTGRDRDVQTEKGWHGTGIFGSIGAAAACASLRGLSPEKSAVAIALAASQSAGLVSNFGTMTKPFHAGRAAHAGVVSARLAQNGFTASLDGLENRGFLNAVSFAGKIDLESPIQAGHEWKLLVDGLNIKKYPMCYGAHCALDGMLDLLRAHKIDPRQVKRVEVSVNRRLEKVLQYHAPKTALEAKFSMEFAMACALISGRVGLSEVTDSFVNRPDIQSLMKQVTVHAKDVDPKNAWFSVDDRVIVQTGSDQSFDTGRLTQVRGGPAAPLSRDELWGKFEDCVNQGTINAAPLELFDAIMSIENLNRINDLPGLAARETNKFPYAELSHTGGSAVE